MQPTQVDSLIHARWVVPIRPEKIFLEHHSLAIKDGKIFDILPTDQAKVKYASQNTFNMEKDHALIPGLVNCHCHTPMSLLRGFADDVVLMDWLLHYMWPAEGKFVSEEFISIGTSLTVTELIQCGVTCVNDMYFYPGNSAEVFEKAGIRASVGLPVLQFPTNYASTPDDYFNKGCTILEKYKNHPHIQVFMAPHAPYTVDDALFNRIKSIAEKYNTRIHIHVQETQKEVDDHIQMHGKRPLQRLDELGLLSDKLLAVHMTALTNDEISLIAKKGVHVIHCPESNLKLGSGICPVSKLLQAGVNVALGTDGPASNDDVDMLGELRTSAMVDKIKVEDPPVPAWKMLEMGTLSGAKALGLDHKIGSLEIGKQADVVAVRITPKPVYNPINLIVYVGTNKVDNVWVDGKLILKNGECTTLDVVKIHEEASKWEKKITDWNTNRKKFNVKEAQDLILLVTSKLKEYQDKQDKSMLKEIEDKYKGQLNNMKDSLFHVAYFAQQEDVGVAKSTLDEISNQISAILQQLGNSA